MNRYFTHAVTIALAITLLAGFGLANAMADDKLTISWLGNNPKGTLLEKDNLVEIYLEEMFNVNLEPWYDVDEYDKNQVNVKIASGEVPDVFRFGEPGTFVEMGAIREVPKELIYEYMPTVIKKCEELAPDTLWNKGNIDGKNWAIPFAINIAKASPLIYIRKDWMEKVGVTKKPGTLQELEALFLKFRNEDPNGNGEKDEYAYMGMYINSHDTISAAEFFPNIFGAFGVSTHPKEFQLNEDGTIRRDTITENYKEALKFLAGWYEKGIIHPEFMINTRKEVEELLANGKAGVYEDWSAWAERDGIGPFQAMQKNNPDITLEYVISPAGPDGTRGVYQRDSAWGTITFGAEVSDEKLIKVMQMLEVIYTDEEVYSMVNLGRKGVDWDLNEQGHVIVLNNSQDKANQAKSGVRYFLHHFIFPPVDKYYVPAWRFNAHNYALENQTQLPIAYTPALGSEDATMLGDLNRYEVEFAYNAIAGKIDIDKEWDSYVAQWNKIGGKKLLATVQEMYDVK